MSALALVAGLGLLGAALRIGLWRRAAPRLASPGPDRPPATTVLLPVRDEEENVEACVRSLLVQTASPQVLVIDDGSEDRTAEIVRRLAAEEPRVELVRAPPLPPGWKGKVHALETGLGRIDAARSPWILSTDADTRHHPELLARALATAEARGLDSLSISGWQQARGLGENLVSPTVFALLDGLLGDWHVVADGEAEVANGQLILMRTAALSAIGGFASLRDAALDDVALARRLRADGFRHGFLRAPDLLRVRMYRGGGATFRGWRRNLGAIFARRGRTVAALEAVLVAPPLLALACLGAGSAGAAAGLWASGVAASALLRAGSRHAPAYGLLYPLDALATALCLGLGLRDASRGVLAAWKGRPVSVDRSRRP